MLHSIVGWDCVLGAWSRIEGYPSDLNPNDPVARIASESLFNLDGRLNPSITILGVCAGCLPSPSRACSSLSWLYCSLVPRPSPACAVDV